MNKHLKTLLSGVALFVALTLNAQALTVVYTGSVVTATGALAALVPPGTPVGGPIDYDDAAVATGLVGPGDINSIDVSVGGFCFSTGPDSTGCPVQPGSLVPITSIDAAAVTFSGTTPTGGTLDVTTFSPSFNIFIPISFDLTAGTFSATSPLGDASGTFQVVPIPAAAWLFGSALLGLAGLRRRA